MELRVLSWLEATDERLLHLSVLNLGEIRKGVASLPQSKRRRRLESWLELEFQARFSGRVLPIDAGIADRWGILTADARKKGVGLATVDGLLAATALHFNLTVVSRNENDFASTPVLLLDPWTA
jgi:toxin FitB